MDEVNQLQIAIGKLTATVEGLVRRLDVQDTVQSERHEENVERFRDLSSDIKVIESDVKGIHVQTRITNGTVSRHDAEIKTLYRFHDAKPPKLDEPPGRSELKWATGIVVATVTIVVLILKFFKVSFS